jgi:hypothetical protein
VTNATNHSGACAGALTACGVSAPVECCAGSSKQIQAILDGCAVADGGGEWRGNLRDRLLFAVLAETGMRLREALGLRINDFVIGRGETAFIEIVPRADNPNGARVKICVPAASMSARTLSGSSPTT